MAKLDGKVALITGAAAGLGEGISTAYAKYGAKLIMVDLSPEVEKTAEKEKIESEIAVLIANIDDLKAQLKTKKDELKAATKDLTKAEAKKAAIEKKAAEEAKKGEAEDVLKKLLANGMTAEEILAKLQ